MTYLTPLTMQNLAARGQGAVVVSITNTYTCGHESGSDHVLMGPLCGRACDEWWDEPVHDLMGDGHEPGVGGEDCIGAEREHAYYEATITASPDRPELVGESRSWEG